MIRPARPDDIPALLAIWNPLIRDTMVTFASIPKTTDDLQQMFEVKRRDGHAFLVAEAGGQVAGFATYGQFRGGNGYRFSMEHTIILGAAARGRGLGRGLIEGLCQHGRAAGVHSLLAGVSSGNPDGVAFHSALGFNLVARIPEVGHKFDKWWDLILMQKILT
jgi:L-amino acid N-acyltransferase YncA